MAGNHAAFLDGPGKPLRVGEASMPAAGEGELIIKNLAIAINPIDGFMQSSGEYIDQYPVVLGHDIAGEIHEVGAGVEKFKKGDRVIAHCWGMVTKRHEDGAFAEYSRVKAGVAAILPANLSFTQGVVMPVAIGTAASALYQNLQLPMPTKEPKSNGKVLLLYGGSSAVGLTTTQLATAGGTKVISIASEKNHSLCKSMGASKAFDQKDPHLVEKLVEAIGSSDDFVGIFDTISYDKTYEKDYEILEKLGGGDLIITHPLPENIPEGVNARMVFALGEFAFPIWEDYVPEALASGELKCFPEALVVGKGLGKIQDGIERYAQGVSAQKIVVEM